MIRHGMLYCNCGERQGARENGAGLLAILYIFAILETAEQVTTLAADAMTWQKLALF
jgi:hypothetical protein